MTYLLAAVTKGETEHTIAELEDFHGFTHVRSLGGFCAARQITAQKCIARDLNESQLLAQASPQ